MRKTGHRCADRAQMWKKIVRALAIAPAFVTELDARKAAGRGSSHGDGSDVIGVTSKELGKD